MATYQFFAGEMKLLFLQNPRGISLAGIFDCKTNRPILSSPGTLFTLTAERLSDGEKVTVRSDADFAESDIRLYGDRAVLYCAGCTALPNVSVTVLLAADAAQNRVTFRTELSSGNDEYALIACDYPTLWFDVDAAVHFLSPYGCGETLDADSERFGHAYGSVQDYPSYGASFQYMATWNDKTGRCLYYGVHDAAPAAKSFHFTRAQGAPSMHIGASQPLCEIDRARNGQALYGECVWQLTDGDWYDATLIYRAWMEQNASWLPERDENGRKDAAWLSDTDAWFLVHIDREDFADEIIESVADLHANCAVHLYLWHNNPFDNDYPHYFPEKPTLRRELKKLQDAGIRVMPYINGRLWDTRDKGTTDWQFTEVAYPNATKDRHGVPFTESYSAKEENGEHTVLAVMCPSTALWQEKLRQINEKLFCDIGFDGVYMDQIAAAKPKPCCDRRHPHLPGGGSWWCESYNNLIEHAASVKDGTVYATECTGEMFMKHIQAYLSWLWMKNQQVPAFPVLYSDKVVTFGISYQSIADRSREGMVIFYAQSLLFGEQMGWLSPALYRALPAKEFFKRLVELRAHLRSFLAHGVMLRPPKLTDDAPRLICEKNMQAYFRTVDYPAVQGALWKEKATGKKLLLLVNAQNVAANVQLEVELPDDTYALYSTNGASLTEPCGTLCLQQGKGSLQIPAETAVWVFARPQTTLCYLERGDEYLLLHRNRKKQDVNRGKWIGVGGKFEEGETPQACMLREVQEETGLVPTSYRYRGVVHFFQGDFSEDMHLFTADGWNGEQKPCDEGELAWVRKDEMETLPMWAGDRIFLRLLAEERPFFSLTLQYEGDTLTGAELDGEPLQI